MTKPAARPSLHRPPLDAARVGIRTKLSALWVAVMFLYVYVDILSFFKPGTIDDILVGRVWTLDITQAWALGALILMSVPILMLVLSLTLPAAAARWTNIVVASLYVIVSFGNTIDETWSYYYAGAAIEAALLVLVVRYAWTWPRPAERPDEVLETERERSRPDRQPLSTARPTS